MTILKILLGIMVAYLWQIEADKYDPLLHLKTQKGYLVAIYSVSIFICLLSTRENVLLNVIFFFFIGLCGMQDAFEMEFQTIYLFPPLIVSIIFNFQQILTLENLLFLPLFIVLLLFVHLKKFGSGDLWIIVIIFFAFGFRKLCTVLLISCVIFFIQNFKNKNNPEAFVPALFIASIIAFAF